MGERLQHVDDPRHRFSYELRLDGQLDARVRELAAELERQGLLPTGAATAPRFQPHLTLARADRVDLAALDALAVRIASRAAITLRSVGTFGAGRIAWFAPEPSESLHDARSSLFDALGRAHLDPLALARDPWVPHVTVAYAIEEPNRVAVQEALGAALPLRGTWRVAQCWDLDVRPTRLVAERFVRPARG